MVAYAWAINLREGDKLEVSLVKDRAPLAENSVTLDRGKAQYMLFAGKKRPPGGWTSGNLHRSGQDLARRQAGH
jgi:hypothetical protein